jgi:hypothetical protein
MDIGKRNDQSATYSRHHYSKQTIAYMTFLTVGKTILNHSYFAFNGRTVDLVKFSSLL